MPKPERTSANLVDSAYIVIGAAALQKDGARLYKAKEKLTEVFQYVSGGDGFYTDGSYVMHVDIPYQGGYGTIMLEALSRVILALDGTFFEVSEKNVATQVAWVFDSFMPLMFKGGLPGMVRGRNIVRSVDDIGIGFAAVTGMLRMAEYADDVSAKKLSSAVKYYYNENSLRYVNSASVFDLCLFKNLAADKTIQPMDALNIVKVFPKMDRVSKLTENYSVGISMASKRIAKYEAINGENGKGWYTGDGMLYIQNTPYDFNYDYWRDVNYYRLPGTTVTTRERTQKNILQKCLPNTAFAGGVTLDNNAVAAMQLLGVTTEFSSTLKAKKAWFLFDDEIVALGADISCSDDYSTETVIENRLINENSVVAADGSRVDDIEGSLINPKSIYLSGFGGIYLPTDSDINYRRTKPGSVFLELWINHGKNFKQETYAYAVLLAKTADEVTDYAKNPDFKIIANNSSVQAVRENELGITGYVFHQKFKFDGIAVDKPCIMLQKQTEDELKVTICDPTQKLSKIGVVLNVNGYKVGTSAGNIKCVISDEAATLTVNTCDKSGLGAAITLVKN